MRAEGPDGARDQTPYGSCTLLPSLCRHDVVEVAGLTSFSFGEDDDCRYVMIFKKVKSLTPLPPLSLSLHLRGVVSLVYLDFDSPFLFISRSLHPQMKN